MFYSASNQFELWVLTCKVHIHVHKQSNSPLFALEFQLWSCFHMVNTFHFEGIAIRMENANSFKEKLKLKSKGISFRFKRYCLQPNKHFNKKLQLKFSKIILISKFTVAFKWILQTYWVFFWIFEVKYVRMPVKFSTNQGHY